MTHRTRVELEQADQHLADDARTDGAKTIAALAHVGFAKDVVPERCALGENGLTDEKPNLPDISGGDFRIRCGGSGMKGLPWRE